MPWPVTHILIAEKVFDRFFCHLDEGAFIVGTCFPDIRYPAKIKREQTHFSDLTLSQIKSQPAFLAGFSFHNMVDGVWNGYVRRFQQTLFSGLPHDRPMYHTLKILQDKYLYHQLDRWQQIAAYFKKILPEEYAFNISEETLIQWHQMLAHYLQKPPNIDDLQMLAISLPDYLLVKIRLYYQKYENHPTLKHLMTGFYPDFENFLRLD